MLNLIQRTDRTCEGVSRRSFLQVGALGGLGLSLPMMLAHKQALSAEGKSESDINCILIYTTGGTSHHDTFDPKHRNTFAARYEQLKRQFPASASPNCCPRWPKT